MNVYEALKEGHTISEITDLLTEEINKAQALIEEEKKAEEERKRKQESARQQEEERKKAFDAAATRVAESLYDLFEIAYPNDTGRFKRDSFVRIMKDYVISLMTDDFTLFCNILDLV